MQCPVCSTKSQRVFQKYEYWIRECESCKHRFCELNPDTDHVIEIYDDSYFEGGGAGYPNYKETRDLLVAHGRRYGQLLRRYTTPGTVLDVGAAAGFILSGLIETGWQGQGIEPNGSIARFAREQMGVHVQQGTLEDFTADQQFDLVNMVQVVAHFHDLRKAFQNAAALTKPGGYWLIETWDKDSWVAKAFGENWHEYSPPSVLHWFSRSTLNHLAHDMGFTQIAAGRPAKWLTGAHAKSLAGHKLETMPLSSVTTQFVKLVPDSLPIPYPTFDLFWGLYRKR